MRERKQRQLTPEFGAFVLVKVNWGVSRGSNKLFAKTPTPFYPPKNEHGAVFVVLQKEAPPEADRFVGVSMIFCSMVVAQPEFCDTKVGVPSPLPHFCQVILLASQVPRCPISDSGLGTEANGFTMQPPAGGPFLGYGMWVLLILALWPFNIIELYLVS